MCTLCLWKIIVYELHGNSVIIDFWKYVRGIYMGIIQALFSVMSVHSTH